MVTSPRSKSFSKSESKKSGQPARYSLTLQRRFSERTAALHEHPPEEKKRNRREMLADLSALAADMKKTWHEPILARLREFAPSVAKSLVDLAFETLTSNLRHESFTKYPDSVFGTVLWNAWDGVLTALRGRDDEFESAAEAAIDDLHALWGDFLRGCLQSFGEPVAASIVNHAFAKLWLKVCDGEEVRGETVLGLLMKIAKNKGRDIWRHNNARKRSGLERMPLDFLDDSESRGAPLNDRLLTDSDAQRELAALIACLMREAGGRRNGDLILSARERLAWLAENIFLPTAARKAARQVGQSFTQCLTRANRKLSEAAPKLAGMPASSWNAELADALKALDNLITDPISEDGCLSLRGSRILAGAMLDAQQRGLAVPLRLGLFVSRRMDVSATGFVPLALKVLGIFESPPSSEGLSDDDRLIVAVRGAALFDHLSEELQDEGESPDGALRFIRQAQDRARPFAAPSANRSSGLVAWAQYQMKIFARRELEIRLSLACDMSDADKQRKELLAIESSCAELYRQFVRSRVQSSPQLAALRTYQAGNVLLLQADAAEALGRPRGVSLAHCQKADRLFRDLEELAGGPKALEGRRAGYVHRSHAEALFRISDYCGAGDLSSKYREKLIADAEAELRCAVGIFQAFDDARQNVACSRIAALRMPPPVLES